MEQNSDQSLFDMNMDGTTQSHILSISKWTKFISVTGFILGGVVLLLCIGFGAQIVKQFSAYFSFERTETGVLIAVVIGAILLIFFWVYFLFRASSLLKRGLQGRNTAQLAEGFRAMRIYFVFSVILSLLSIFSTLKTMI